MKLALSIIGSIKKDMEQELSSLEKAVMTGVKKAGVGLKLELRSQVVSAGLSQKLANTWRLAFYENKKINSASLVYSKAPEVISSFDKGVVIKSGSGFWLAIPTPNAPKKGIGGKRINPSNFPEDRLGKLRFVYRKNKTALLVVDEMQASFNKADNSLKGFRKASQSNINKGRVLSVVMFILVPQVKLPKKLDIASAAKNWNSKLPDLIDDEI